MTAQLPPAVLEKAIAETALGRIAEPEDVARVVVFLCTEGARQITGEVIRVDGGQLA
jgi:NAD(P)-dependent dehydrogenase (short-subunit alcohol dehydrogenase family)